MDLKLKKIYAPMSETAFYILFSLQVPNHGYGIGQEVKKMTQNEVASILNISPATMSKYESNALEPSIESLKKLAEIFEISVDELIENEENKFDISKINILGILREQKDMNLKGNLYHNTQITFAYNTNHIEGSQLTEDQTR